jgi:hypothetical protein
VQLELERRYSHGLAYQVFYLLSNSSRNRGLLARALPGGALPCAVW